jgi:hypothetical protein
MIGGAAAGSQVLTPHGRPGMQPPGMRGASGTQAAPANGQPSFAPRGRSIAARQDR